MKSFAIAEYEQQATGESHKRRWIEIVVTDSMEKARVIASMHTCMYEGDRPAMERLRPVRAWALERENNDGMMSVVFAPDGLVHETWGWTNVPVHPRRSISIVDAVLLQPDIVRSNASTPKDLSRIMNALQPGFGFGLNLNICMFSTEDGMTIFVDIPGGMIHTYDGHVWRQTNEDSAITWPQPTT